jgi:hypothetical protein
VIYALIFAADVVVLYLLVTHGVQGIGYVTLTVVGVVGLLLAYQLLLQVRDVGAPPVETIGVINRKWSRADLIIAWQSHYITVERTVFNITPIDYLLLKEGATVRVVHFPRTLRVVSVEEVTGAPPAAPIEN